MKIIDSYDHREETQARKKYPQYFEYFELATRTFLKLENAEFMSLAVIDRGAKTREFELIYSLEEGCYNDHPNLAAKFPGSHYLEFASVSFSGSETSGQWNIEAFDLTVD